MRLVNKDGPRNHWSWTRAPLNGWSLEMNRSDLLIARGECGPTYIYKCTETATCCSPPPPPPPPPRMPWMANGKWKKCKKVANKRRTPSVKTHPFTHPSCCLFCVYNYDEGGQKTHSQPNPYIVTHTCDTPSTHSARGRTGHKLCVSLRKWAGKKPKEKQEQEEKSVPAESV